jgi:hypothetical protein
MHKTIDVNFTSEDRLEIHKSQSTKRLVLSFSELALLKEMTPQTAHADIIAYPLKGEICF